jgi:RNA polymerase sigma factor (sigma-70 family)
MLVEKSPGGAVTFVRDLAAGWQADHADDSELISRFVTSRDEHAFAALVRRHGPGVWRVCRAIVRNDHDADDAFQASFLLLAQKANRLRSTAAVAAWLCGVAYRVAVRAKARASRSLLALPDVAAPVTTDAVAAREDEQRLIEDLAGLPEKYRTPLVLCCLEGLTREEAARRLGWSLNTLKSRLEYGRELLRRRLQRRGVLGESPSSTLLAPPAPAVTPGLIASTVRVAFGASVPSPAVVTLTSEVRRIMWMSNLKWVAALVVAIVFVTAGVAITVAATRSTPEEKQEPAPLANSPAPKPAPERKPEAKEPTAESVATDFLKHALSGQVAKAKALCYPGNVSENKIKEMVGAGLKEAKLLAVIPSGLKPEVLAITAKASIQVKENRKEEGHLVLMLVRSKDDKHWQVKDIDFADAKKVARALELHRKAAKPK